MTEAIILANSSKIKEAAKAKDIMEMLCTMALGKMI